MVTTANRTLQGRGLTHLGRLDPFARISQAQQSPAKPSGWRSWRRWAVAAVVLVAASTAAWLMWSRVVATGIVTGEVITFEAPASVEIADVYVEPGQWCEQGQALVKLVGRDVDAARTVLAGALDQAKLRLEMVERGAEIDDIKVADRPNEFDQLGEQLAVAEAAVASARASLVHARQEQAAYTSLRKRDLASEREVNRAVAEASVAEANLAGAQAHLDGVRSRWLRQRAITPGRSDAAELRQLELAHLAGAVRQAEQRLAQFDYESGSRTIVAPFAGLVDRIYVTKGSHRSAGDPLLDIYDPNSLYVVAYIDPEDRDRCEVGTSAKLYPQGSSAPASGWIRQVHRVWGHIPGWLHESKGPPPPAVTMRIDTDAPGHARLAPNMVVRIVVKRGG